MKVASSLLLLLLIGQGGAAFCAQFSGHKSESEVARMTPEQRVGEYCREYARHGARHGDYTDMVHRYVMGDGIMAVPALTRIIEEYDPTTREGRSAEKGRRFDAASGLGLDIDETVVRLRATTEGRRAIAALRRVIERMRAAGFHSDADLDDEKRVWYESSIDALQRMEGINWLDKAIQDTLRIRLKIRLTDQELLDFVNCLISKDPHYPTGIGLDLLKDFNDLNEAGNPRQYRVLIDIEPFHKAYRECKPKDK